MTDEIVRTIVICARPETVFRFFTDSERFARWWGAGSRIDPRPGGELVIRYPDGTVALGTVQEIAPPSRIAFSYGYEDPAKPIPPGGSRVTVTCEPVPEGTRVTLRHGGISAEVAREHAAGWRFQLALYAKAAAADAHFEVDKRVDEWFAAWGETDPARRQALLASCVADAVTFRDDYACISGADDLAEHIRAVQQHIPGRVERDGKVAFCQGSALVRWRALKPDGGLLGAGANLYDLAPDGRIARVVGFWGA